MNNRSTLFLQAVVVLVGILVLFLLVRLPLSEGRVEHLDLFHIYADPFVLYIYLSSLAFFVALYKAFRLLGYIGQGQVFSISSTKALRSIRFAMIALIGCIVSVGIYIRLFHHPDDDPAGFLALCSLAVFVCMVIALIASVCEGVVQSGMEMKAKKEGVDPL